MRSDPVNRVPEAVFFDLDGTLLDSLPGIQFSVEAAFAACGLTMRNVPIQSLIGPPIRVIFSGICAEASERDLDCLERAFRASYDKDGWQRTYYYPGAKEMLERFQTWGIRAFVVSNKPLHVVLKILEASGTLSFFQDIVTRDSPEQAFAGKAEMMSWVLATHKVRSQNCLMVGDTLEDAEAAACNGIQFCLMTHGYGDVPAGCGVPVGVRFDSFAAFMAKAAKEWKNG